MKVRIHPAMAYAHGHIENVLIQIGITPPVRRPDGVVEIDLSEAQITQFQLRGNAHRVERVQEGTQSPAVAVPPAAPAAAPVAAPAAEKPTFATVVCPWCAKDNNIVIALAPAGGTFELGCSHCGKPILVNRIGDVFEVEKPAPIPPAIVIPTLEETVKAGYSKEAGAKIIERQTKLKAWVDAGNSAETFQEK